MRGAREIDQDKGKEGLWQRLRRKYDSATLQCVRAELMGRQRLVLQGCREILQYEPECIVLAVRDPDVSAVCIAGEELLCLSYHADAVVVEGCIESVMLCRHGKERSDRTRRQQ